ncbi:MAG TPA: M23 family metallopeptidase, partial [Thermomicrobiales bacterium]|nr:M23 family metallopeptidase [Thermomicrobiales bacterium]
AAGNAANPVSFAVTVSPLPEPTPTDPPAPTEEPAPTETPQPTATTVPAGEPAATATPAPAEKATEEPTTAATATPPPPADGETSDPPPGPTPAALPLDESLLGSFVLVADGGPLGVLTSIWGNEDFPVSQEFGHTAFSVTHHSWYAYGADYGLDGYAHPGLDVGMPAGTPLYAPVDGIVEIAGGTPYYTFYGNGASHVGELLIETEDGDQVILGHLGRIAVDAGDAVEVGQFVGLSGGDNGDHLHLEARERQPLGAYKIVDPRQSFLVDALTAALEKAQAKESTGSDDPGFESLSQPVGRVAAVGDETGDKYARITVRRVNCAVDATGDAVAACDSDSDVLAGSSFTVYNPTMHGTTRITDPTGLVSFGPRAGENVIEKEVDGAFAGAYVSCVAEHTGRVVFDGPIAEPSLTLNTEPGDQITCNWFNLAT